MQDSHYPDEWKTIARKDWKRMDILLANDDAEGAAFFLQQSVEKLLKAFLLSKGWKLKRTHELDALLDYAIDFDSELEKFRDLCEKVTGYYFTERYPILVSSELTVDDIQADRTETEKFVRALFPDES